MPKLSEEIDLHIVAILILFLPWPLLMFLYSERQMVLVTLFIPLLIPQGIIFTRFFWDYPAMGRARIRFLLVNESVILSSVGVVVGLAYFVAWVKSMAPA